MEDVIEEAEDVESQQQQQQQQQQQSVLLRTDNNDDWYELQPGEEGSFPARQASFRSRHRSISYRGGSERSSRRHHKKKKSAWQKFKDFVRVVFSYVFSSVGICVLVMIYLFLGAYAFMAVEGEAEAEANVTFQVAAYRKKFVQRLWVITDRLNTLHPGNWTEEVAVEIATFQADFIAQVGDGYAGQDVPTPKWSYSGSLLYAITVITTIGKSLFTLCDQNYNNSSLNSHRITSRIANGFEENVLF